MSTITANTTVTTTVQAEVIDPRLINPRTGSQYKGKALASRLAEIQKLEEEGKAVTIAMTLKDETTEPTAMAVAPNGDEIAEEKEAPVANPEPTSTVVVDGLCVLYTEAFVASKARMFEEAKKRHDSATAEYVAAFAAFEGMKESEKGYSKAKKRQEQAKSGVDSRFGVMMAAQNAAAQAEEKCIALFSARNALEAALEAYQASKAQKVGEDKAEKSAAQKSLQEAFKSLQDSGLALLELAKHLAKKEDFLADPIKVGEAMVEQLSGSHLQASIQALQPKVVETVVKEKKEAQEPQVVRPQPAPKKEKKEDVVDARLKRAELLKEQAKLVEAAHNALIELAQTAPSNEVCEIIDEELKLLASIKATAERWIAGEEGSFEGLEVRVIKQQIDAEASRIIAWAKRSQPTLSMPNFAGMLKPCGWNSPGAAYISLEQMHQAIQNMMADGAEGSAEQALAKHLLAKGRCPTLVSAKAAHEAALKFDGTWEQAEAKTSEADWDKIEAEYEREMDDLQDAFYEFHLSAAIRKEPAPIPAVAPVTETPEVAATVAASNPKKEAQMSPFETFCASGATEDEILAVICRITGQKLSARAELTEKNQRKLDRATLETLQGALVAHRKSKAEQNERFVRKAIKQGEKKAKEAKEESPLKKWEILALAYEVASKGDFSKAAKLLRQAGEVVPVLSTDDFVTLALFDAMVRENILPDEVALPDDETIKEIMAINASIFKRVWSRAKGGVKKVANKVRGFFRKEPKAEAKAEGEKKEGKPTLREQLATIKASFKAAFVDEEQVEMTRFERAKKDLVHAGKDVLIGGAFAVGSVAVAAACAVAAPIYGVGAAWSLIRGRKDEAKARIKKAGWCVVGVAAGAFVSAVGVVTATLGAAVDLLSSAYNAIVGVGKAIGSFFKGLFSKKAEVAVLVAAV